MNAKKFSSIFFLKKTTFFLFKNFFLSKKVLFFSFHLRTFSLDPYFFRSTTRPFPLPLPKRTFYWISGAKLSSKYSTFYLFSMKSEVQRTYLMSLSDQDLVISDATLHKNTNLTGFFFFFFHISYSYSIFNFFLFILVFFGQKVSTI